uniref:BICC1 first type I KH domain-containing protein n=1 Tax=Trichogramma kaykai TaxID=54128 RepID=A0ABD2VR73_9HYME
MRPIEAYSKERCMSETSEGTTTTATSCKSSIDNVDELRNLAAVLGILDPENLHQERFRVDRRKLEQMLLGQLYNPSDDSSPVTDSAESFFSKVRISVSRRRQRKHSTHV